ncbi:hypothetical protein BDZ91DRAFT_752683, partial [Kalaharituber pfeilii]
MQGKEVAIGSGVRQRVKAWRKEKREVEGFGGGKVMEWSRGATSHFTALRLERGRCARWLKKLGVAESDRCRCGQVQTGENGEMWRTTGKGQQRMGRSGMSWNGSSPGSGS